MSSDNRLVMDVPMAELNRLTGTEKAVDPRVGSLTLREVNGLMAIMPEGPQKNDAIGIIKVFENLTVADLFNLARKYKDGEKLLPEEDAKVQSLLAAKVDLQLMSAKTKL